jgi:hypothetical protein
VLRMHDGAVGGACWGAVAQLGERLVRNEEVSGSIPLSSTKECLSCEWLDGVSGWGSCF